MNLELLCFPSAADVPDSDLGRGFKRQLPYKLSLFCMGGANFISLAEGICTSLGPAVSPPLPVWWLYAHGHLNP